MAAILKDLGYDSGIVIIPGHCATVLKGNPSIAGLYYEQNGNRYYAIESTCKRRLGDVTNDFDWYTVKNFIIF